MSTILTWNIRHGGGTRVKKICEVLENYVNAKPETSVQIIVLTEFRNNAQGRQIQEFLTEKGCVYQFSPEAEEKTNTVLLASRVAIETKVFSTLGPHAHRVIKADYDDISIYACYFPQQDEKKHLFEFLLKEIRLNPGKPIIITGDINTGKHFIDEEKATFFHADYFTKLEEAGMVHAFRMFHPSAREYSWYTNRGTGFRIDHFLVSKNLAAKIANCYYDHEARLQKISDHSMMILKFEK